MEYKNYLIFKDVRRGYVTSNRYIIFDTYFKFQGSNDSEEEAKYVIDYLIRKEKEETEKSIRMMQCGCLTEEAHHSHTVYCDACDNLFDDNEISEINGVWLCDECQFKRGKIEKILISFLRGQVSFEKDRKASPDTGKSVWTDEYHEGYIDGLKRAMELIECGDYMSEY